MIGEISNASGPWRKFTQTFFLAEQPNGYFVLNDIFRYLKEEDEEHDEGDDEDSVAAEQVEETEQPAAPVEEQPVADVHPISTEPAKVSVEIIDAPAAPPVSELAESTPPVAEAPETVVPKEETPAVTEPQQEPATSEPAKEESKEEPVSAAETASAPEPVVEAEKPAPAAPEPEKEAPVQHQQPKPTPPSETQRQSPAPRGKPAPAPAPAAAPTPAAPPKPRTWASTAAAKPNAWGTALATKEALSASASAPAVPAGVQRTASAQKTAQQQPKQGQTAQPASAPAVQTSGHKYPLVEAAKAVQTPICFIKVCPQHANAVKLKLTYRDSSTTGKPKTQRNRSPNPSSDKSSASTPAFPDRKSPRSRSCVTRHAHLSSLPRWMPLDVRSLLVS